MVDSVAVVEGRHEVSLPVCPICLLPPSVLPMFNRPFISTYSLKLFMGDEHSTCFV